MTKDKDLKGAYNIKKRRLLIISDTAMFRVENEVFAFGPVVREVEAFKSLFCEITWIGFYRPEYENDQAFMKVDSNFVNTIMIAKSGGNSFFKKVAVLLKLPRMMKIIFPQVVQHHVIHTRAPSSPAFIGLFLSFVFRSKIWWHKYAGNWAQINPPFFYGLQIRCLKMARHTKVTINGFWPNQPAHCLSFENPTITREEQLTGYEAISGKGDPPYNFCFVGRLETEKGLSILLNALHQLKENELFGELHIVGSGPLQALCLEYEKKYSSLIFHGSLSRSSLNLIYAKCHFLYLPSRAAEGFPKVIAEAANFGCIPILSKISSISHYIFNGVNGFLLDDLQFTEDDIVNLTNKVISNKDLRKIALAAFEFSQEFTYERYLNRIETEILG